MKKLFAVLMTLAPLAALAVPSLAQDAPAAYEDEYATAYDDGYTVMALTDVRGRWTGYTQKKRSTVRVPLQVDITDQDRKGRIKGWVSAPGLSRPCSGRVYATGRMVIRFVLSPYYSTTMSGYLNASCKILTGRWATSYSGPPRGRDSGGASGVFYLERP